MIPVARMSSVVMSARHPNEASLQSDARRQLEAERSELIAEFEARPALACEFLRLDAVAEFMARVRGESSPAAALADLMGHASVGAFDCDKPALLLLRKDVGVDLQWINPVREADDGEQAPPAAQIDSADIKLMRGIAGGDDTVVSEVMPHCWARRETVVALLLRCGVDRLALPSSWDHVSRTAAGGGTETPRKAKRGRRFKYDWIEGRQFFNGLMSQMGDLDDRADWSAQADIERRVMAHMTKHGGGEPSPSLTQEHVASWLADYRAPPGK
jgi:hypothetical protein